MRKSKLERELIPLEREIEENKNAVAARVAAATGTLGRARNGVAIALFAIMYDMPLLTFRPAHRLWPLGWFFGFPGLPPGSIGVLPFLLVWHQATTRLS